MFRYALIFFAFYAFIACKDNTSSETNPSLAILENLILENSPNNYEAIIIGQKVSFNTPIPFETTKLFIKEIKLSKGATCAIKKGDSLQISDFPLELNIQSEDLSTTQTYTIEISRLDPANEAEIKQISFSIEGKTQTATIAGSNIKIDNELRFDTSGRVIIERFEITKGATSNLQLYSFFELNEAPEIIITSADKSVVKRYQIDFHLDPEGISLFNHFDQKATGFFEQIRHGEFIIENNTWGTSNLDEGSFSQSIYLKETNDNTTYGWKWDFPEHAQWVTAYPEIIYGWKPHGSTNTSQHFPIRIGDIKHLKVQYDIKMVIDYGDYNLAFDNWITRSDTINTDQIEYEMMVWEDYSFQGAAGNKVGSYQTTNGDYDLYVQHKDVNWNWTYIAFIRINKRRSGVVDMDELIQILLDEKIISADHVLSSIEFGNELGASSGYTIVKNLSFDWD